MFMPPYGGVNFPYKTNLNWIVCQIIELKEKTGSLEQAWEDFQKTFGQSLSKTVNDILQQWYDNGMLAALIQSWIDALPLTSVKDTGAKGDGITDDSDAIQLALNNGGFILFPKGTYVVSKQLNLVSDSCLFGDGATIKQITTNIKTFYGNKVSNICIKNLDFVNNEKAAQVGTQEQCIYLDNSSDITVDNCYFDNFVSGFVCAYLEPSYNENILINNCRFNRYDFAILPSQYKNMTIKGCSGTNVEKTHLNASSGQLDPPHLIYGTDRASDLTPDGLFISDCIEYGNPYSCSFKVRNCKNLSITNCTSNNAIRGLELASCTDFVVSNMIFSGMAIAPDTDTQASVLFMYDCKNGIVHDIVIDSSNDDKYIARLETDLTEANKQIKFVNITAIVKNTRTARKRPFSLKNSKDIVIDGLKYTNTGDYYDALIFLTNSDCEASDIHVKMDAFSAARIVLASTLDSNSTVKILASTIFLPSNTVQVNTEAGGTGRLIVLTDQASG